MRRGHFVTAHQRLLKCQRRCYRQPYHGICFFFLSFGQTGGLTASVPRLLHYPFILCRLPFSPSSICSCRPGQGGEDAQVQPLLHRALLWGRVSEESLAPAPPGVQAAGGGHGGGGGGGARRTISSNGCAASCHAVGGVFFISFGQEEQAGETLKEEARRGGWRVFLKCVIAFSLVFKQHGDGGSLLSLVRRSPGCFRCSDHLAAERRGLGGSLWLHSFLKTLVFLHLDYCRFLSPCEVAMMFHLLLSIEDYDADLHVYGRA